MHTPGFDWRHHITDGTTLDIEGGYPIQSNGETGYLAEAFFSSNVTERLTLEARARALDDTQFRVVSVVLGPRYKF